VNTKKTQASEKLPDVFWVTRDTDQHGLSDEINVWISRPELQRTATGLCWLGTGVTGIEDRIETWTVAQCLKNIGTYPETARECIRRGEPVPIAQTASVMISKRACA